MVNYYATSSVASALFRYRSPGGAHWARIASEGAAGTTYVTYRNTVSGHRVVIGVSNVELGQGDAHAAYTVRISLRPRRGANRTPGCADGPTPCPYAAVRMPLSSPRAEGRVARAAE